jgi:DNA-binding GntR family transcriptional regulator
VAPLSLVDFKDIYAVRRGLEGTAALLGTPSITDADIAKMRAVLTQLDRVSAAAEINVDLYLTLEWEMHLTCYQASGHQRLLGEIQSYRRQAERYFRLALGDGVNLLDDLRHQRGFCAACTDRDPQQAESMAQLLLDWTVERVAPLIEDMPGATVSSG